MLLLFVAICCLLLLLSAQEEVSEGRLPPFRLELFQVVWRSLQRCWSVDVFLETLIHRLWKLTLQVSLLFPYSQEHHYVLCVCMCADVLCVCMCADVLCVCVCVQLVSRTASWLGELLGNSKAQVSFQK